MQRRRLLFASEVFPFPLDRGQNVRVRNLLAACAEHFDVTYFGPTPPDGAEAQRLSTWCSDWRLVDTGTPPQADLRAWLSALRAAPGIRRPRTVRRYLSLAVALAALEPERYDLIWAERLPMARLFGGPLASRTIVDLDDLEHIKIRRELALRGMAAPLRERYRYLLYRHAELHRARRYRAAVVCSAEDRDYLAAHGSCNALVIPNGADFAEPLPRPLRTAQAPLRTVFLGNLDYPPNADAVLHYAEAVLPLLRARIGGATFEIIGQGGDAALRARLGEHALLHGYVPDLGRLLAACDVFVVPLRYGGGTKLKVLEAMAHGIPLVTSGVGAEGLGLRDGVHALLAETPEAFAAAVARVGREPALAARLAHAAHAHGRSHFCWSAIRAETARATAALAGAPAVAGVLSQFAAPVLPSREV